MTPRIHSPNFAQHLSRWSIVAVAVSVFACGIVWRNANLLGVGAVILCFVLRRLWDRSPNETANRSHRGNRKRENDRSAHVDTGGESERPGGEPDSVAELAQRDCPPKS